MRRVLPSSLAAWLGVVTESGLCLTVASSTSSIGHAQELFATVYATCMRTVGYSIYGQRPLLGMLP
jgi:hypothetical protein